MKWCFGFYFQTCHYHQPQPPVYFITKTFDYQIFFTADIFWLPKVIDYHYYVKFLIMKVPNYVLYRFFVIKWPILIGKWIQCHLMMFLIKQHLKTSLINISVYIWNIKMGENAQNAIFG